MAFCVLGWNVQTRMTTKNYLNHWTRWQSMLVGGQLICCTPRDEKSHGDIYDSCAYTSSCKQKINTKSSTEAELVAIDDAMAQILWTRHFLAAQGIPVPITTIYQDNKCTILLSENGKASSSNRTKHLDVCYFFITDRIKWCEVKVVPYWKHGGRFFHQATSRCSILTYV